MTEPTKTSATDELFSRLIATPQDNPGERLALIRALQPLARHDIDGPFDSIHRCHPSVGYEVDPKYHWDCTGLNGEWSIIFHGRPREQLAYVIVRDKVLNEDGSPKWWVLRVRPEAWRVLDAVPWTFGCRSHAWNPVAET